MVVVDLETVWIIPQKRIVFYVKNGYSESEIIKRSARLLHQCLTRSNRISEYLFNPIAKSSRRLAFSDFSCPHLSHNLWNVQTGWSNLLRLSGKKTLAHVFLFENQNYAGELDKLYPEIDFSDGIEYVKDDETLFDLVIDGNYLLCTVKDEFFTKEFSERVLAVARANCSQDFLEEIEQLRKNYQPLVVTTVRLDNRSWLEQEQGIPALFTKLAEKFPHIAVIIDGLSSDTVKGWATNWMSMEAELTAAKNIQVAMAGFVNVIVAVGRPFAESLVLSAAADAFIAPSGSGMTLYKWLWNQPGIAFSNTVVLDEHSGHSWPLRVWHNPQFRHDVTPTLHLSSNLVTDVSSVRDHVSRANFHLDWKDLYTISLPFLTELTDQDKTVSP